MYESALVFISILKEKNLYIVGCVQCDIWDITAYFLLPELKYYNELLVYLWLLEITKVRIRFWNDLFKADKKKLYSEFDCAKCFPRSTKVFQYLNYFLITE